MVGVGFEGYSLDPLPVCPLHFLCDKCDLSACYSCFLLPCLPCHLDFLSGTISKNKLLPQVAFGYGGLAQEETNTGGENKSFHTELQQTLQL